VHRSTISRELQRNSDGRSGEYKLELAQRKSAKRLRGRNHHRKFTDDLKTQVDILIRKDLSPEQIAGYVDEKKRLGDLEIDTVMGKNHKGPCSP